MSQSAGGGGGAALRYSQYVTGAGVAGPQQQQQQQQPLAASAASSVTGAPLVAMRQSGSVAQQGQPQHFMRPPMLVTSSGASMLPPGGGGGGGAAAAGPQQPHTGSIAAAASTATTTTNTASNGNESSGLPKYPGSSRDLSGSDTDVSTSNENLSREERYVLSHARVEPQGEENLQGNVTPVNELQGRYIGDKFSSNTSSDSTRYATPTGGSSRSISESRTGTMYSASMGGGGGGGGPGAGPGNDGSSNRSSMAGGGGGTGSNRNSLKEPNSNRSSMDVSQSSYNTLIIHDDIYGGAGGMIGSSVSAREYAGSPPPYMKKERPRSYGEACQVVMQEISEIPEEYLSQSHVLKHLAKEVKLLPGATGVRSTRSASLARDTMASEGKQRHGPRQQAGSIATTDGGDCKKQQHADPDHQAGQAGNGKLKSKSQPDLTRLYDIEPEELEALVKENHLLKQQLNNCYLKVAKSQKLEQEIANIYRVHEELVQSCDRRERLERAARTRLQQDCRRLQELNRAFRDQVEVYQSQLHASSDHQLGRTQQDVLISQLVNQNKSLVDANRRQCIELQAQNATLEEQRIHINVLDTALKRLEEECRQKQVYVERCAQLQHALQSLQNASERREQAERKLRIDYEHDMQPNRSGSSSTSSETDNLKWQLREKDAQIMRLEAECSKLEQRNLEESNVRNVAKLAMERNSQETERILAEAKQEKIRYLDEAHAANRKVTELQTRLKLVENRLAEKDAMIRAYQGQKIYGGSTNSYGSYNLSTDSFALNPLGAYNSQPSYVDVSASSYDVVSATNGAGSLLDPSVVGPYVSATSAAVVASSYASTYGQNNNNPSFVQSSLNLPGGPSGSAVGSSVGLNGVGGGSGGGGGSATGCYSSPSSSSTTSNYCSSSTNYGSGTTTAGSSEHTIFDSKNYDAQRKSIDDQLKQLDEQLLNKRGLCCFPSLTTKKPIQSLLADEVSVLSANNSEAFLQNLTHLTGTDRRSEQPPDREPPSGGGGSNTQNQQKADDMVLLEKQGRCSQKLRGGSNSSATTTTSTSSTLSNLAHVSHTVGQNMTDISNIGGGSAGGNKLTGGSGLRGSSLPPSALPRPPRSLKPPRKIEYGRLSDGGSGPMGDDGTVGKQKKNRAATPPSPSAGHSSPKDVFGASMKRPSAVGGREYSPAKGSGGYGELKDTLQLTKDYGGGGGSLRHKSYGSMNAVTTNGAGAGGGGSGGGVKFGFGSVKSGGPVVDYPSTRNYQRLEEPHHTGSSPSSSQSRKSSGDSGTLKRSLLPNVRKLSGGGTQQTITKGGSRDSLNSASSESNHSTPGGGGVLSRSSPLRSVPSSYQHAMAAYHGHQQQQQQQQQPQSQPHNRTPPPRFIHHQQSTSAESTKSNYTVSTSSSTGGTPLQAHGYFTKFSSQSVSPGRTIPPTTGQRNPATQPKSSCSLPSSSVLHAAVNSSATSAIGQSSTASLPPKPVLEKQLSSGPATSGGGSPSNSTTSTTSNQQQRRGNSLARVGNKYRIQF
ncbi:uncharacterized protein LOC126578392 [Anopheles aquasalis]|uniref:uncharacterized protein LOC126578392 n=1 Tax=Anopheles aquasalis TaxID=42839 RepID=UPI00215A97DF|nr:uncharacterized protein LOC126578392 [Anopheles aquasalis]XP_050096847.1 uncharacterized protein LOC126578392 [Anopheles aquasalis]XP_050096848.1 uncharacterized protein LOC126578392 [Anopheles aquasalis]XP_050096849.1 uncharacterized protein LOC126578392 [Anopheles aquasalis]XP_050096851.1 uncharacterized protein LOC126578392 [Anopheles aquasalis]